MGELEKDMAQLRKGMRDVSQEIEFHRNQPVTTGDRFLPVMKDFLAQATTRFSELEDLFQDMKTRVRIQKSEIEHQLQWLVFSV
jgi:dishevelled associated activator of morphogenesis